MIEFNFFNLYYYLSQSLVGRITTNIIGISVECIREDKIALHVYLNKSPSAMETENIHSALSETDSYFDKGLDYEIKFKVIEGKISKNEMHSFWLFLQYIE